MVDNVEYGLDLERQQQARSYSRDRRIILLSELLISVIYLSLWIFTGLGIQVGETVQAFTQVNSLLWWLALLAYASAFALPFILLTLPLSFFSGYTLPHHYGVSTQSIQSWALDQLKGALLAALLGVPLLLGLYALIRLQPAGWWLPAAVLYSLVTVLLATLAPVLLMPIFNKFEPLGNDHAALAARLAVLAERSGTHVQGVYRMDMSQRTRAANAALVGIGRTRRIVLGDTLLSDFSPQEVEVVLAHEFGHHVHKDIQLGIVVQSLLNLALFYLASAALNLAVPVVPLRGNADPAGLPILVLVLGLTGFLTMPLSNAYSRWRERMADSFALRSTGLAKDFASAMTRLANQNLADVDPAAWVVFLFGTHPPLSQRIACANAYLAAGAGYYGNSSEALEDPAEIKSK